MDLIPNDSKHLLRIESYQKFSLRTFYYNNKDTREVKDFQKLSDQEKYFTFQSNKTNYNKPFKFVSRANSLERHNIRSHKIWGRGFTEWFKKCPDEYKLSNLQFIEWTTHQIFCVPDIKKERNLFSFLIVTLNQYSKTFGVPATLITLLVPGVNTPPYCHKFKSLLYIKTMVKCIKLLFRCLTYVTF